MYNKQGMYLATTHPSSHSSPPFSRCPPPKTPLPAHAYVYISTHTFLYTIQSCLLDKKSRMNLSDLHSFFTFGMNESFSCH